LPDAAQVAATDLLTFSLPYMQQVVDSLWPNLDAIGQIKGRHIWRPLEGQLPRPLDLPSRLWRCVLEGAGRTLRAQASRKRVFDLLLPLLKPEHFTQATDGTKLTREADDKLLKLAYQLQDELGDNQEKIGYLVNLIEHIAHFYAKNEHLPADYYELQTKPSLKVPQLILAADDGPVKGQVYRLSVEGRQLTLCFKYPTPDGQWFWTPDMTLTLPEAIDPTEPLAPILRLKEIKGGETIAVLDFITTDTTPQGVPTGDNLLAFDWGVRRLLSFVVLNRAGEQLTPPTFVNIGGLAGKLARLRWQIDDLKTKKAKLRKRERVIVQAEIDACWRKYNATNEALAHFASNLLLVFALIFHCDTLAGEWLGTLKAKKKKNNYYQKVRTLNWKVNTTIREMIWTKLEYKTPRYHLITKKVWPRGSSHECPRCGSRGVTCKSPEHRSQVSPFGHWFFCKDRACGYNADRDYVAALNIGRRALVEAYPSEEKTGDIVCQPVSYTGAGAALPFPPPDRRGGRKALIPPPLLSGQICLGLLHRLGTTLIGFNQAIAVSPIWLPAPPG
jgi:hypothetical protein